MYMVELVLVQSKSVIFGVVKGCSFGVILRLEQTKLFYEQHNPYVRVASVCFFECPTHASP